MTGRTLYTIGYEKTLLKDVISTLAAARVPTLIDVRDRPISRRPGFSKRQLAAAIEEAGMRYVHLQALGTPPEGRLRDIKSLLSRAREPEPEAAAKPN